MNANWGGHCHSCCGNGRDQPVCTYDLATTRPHVARWDAKNLDVRRQSDDSAEREKRNCCIHLVKLLVV